MLCCYEFAMSVEGSCFAIAQEISAPLIESFHELFYLRHRRKLVGVFQQVGGWSHLHLQPRAGVRRDLIVHVFLKCLDPVAQIPAATISKEACPWHADTCMLTAGADSWVNSENCMMGSSFVLRA